MDAVASLLAAYDAELRTDAETPSAVSVARLGPLRLVTFAGGRGFVTYKDLGGADAQTIQSFVTQAVAHFRRDPQIDRFEWKTRAHDHAPGLHDALLNNGFTADEPEAIMIGEANLLAVDVPLPAGVQLRLVTTEADVRAMCAMVAAVFGDPTSEAETNALLRRLTFDDGMELWVAERPGTNHQRRTTRAGPRKPVRRHLGRCDQTRLARPGNLSGTDGGTREVRAARRQDAHPL